MKHLILFATLTLIALLLIPISAYQWIEWRSRPYLYNNPHTIPAADSINTPAP